MRAAAVPLLLLALALPPGAGAAPYTPASDGELVERLPLRLAGAERRQRAQLSATPTDLPLALQLAHAAIARARRDGDPRELGQAQAALAPWWRSAAAPASVRLLRASIRQSQHQFGPALQELQDLLDEAATPLPIQAQAELSRAALMQLRGRWPEAEAGCTRLTGSRYAALGPMVALHGRICLAELASLRGATAEAERELARLAGATGAPHAWIALLRAELAERRGSADAETLYRQALALAPEVYTRAAYADWLLAQRRWRDAAALLQDQQASDALRLRLAIAWQRGGDARAAAARGELAQRFAAAQERGADGVGHERELARFALDLQGDAPAALRHALANWVQQREPADALLLVRAAHAAGRPKAAAEVLALGLVDRRLETLR